MFFYVSQTAAIQKAWKASMDALTSRFVQSLSFGVFCLTTFEDILDLMGDRLLDNSSRGAFDGSFKVTGDNKGHSMWEEWLVVRPGTLCRPGTTW